MSTVCFLMAATMRPGSMPTPAPLTAIVNPEKEHSLLAPRPAPPLKRRAVC